MRILIANTPIIVPLKPLRKRLEKSSPFLHHLYTSSLFLSLERVKRVHPEDSFTRGEKCDTRAPSKPGQIGDVRQVRNQ